MKLTARDWTLLIVLSVLWGGSFFFVAIAVREVPPLTVVLLRVSLAALLLFFWLRVRGEKLPTAIPVFLVMGLLNNVIPFSLLFWAQTTIASGLASILNATTPIFSMLIAHALLADEPMQTNRLAGVLLGLLGVAVLIGGNALQGMDISTLGMLACLAAAFSYGLASVYGRRFKAMQINPTAGAFGQLAASSLIMMPVVIFIDRPWTLPAPGFAAVISIIALATVSTALAYLIYFRLLAACGAVNVALVTLLIPLSAVLLGIVFLGEQPEPKHIAGMALIACGLLAVDGRLCKSLLRKKTVFKPGSTPRRAQK
ncbi:MAG: EamA family transporter [Gammaproteobacteria bacterium]|nr:EamA family transporter [Gammaproteobacteria bacterium]